MDASVTNSNRRVRTRTHGGVAGCAKPGPPRWGGYAKQKLWEKKHGRVYAIGG